MKKRAQRPNAQTFTIIFRGCAQSLHPKTAVAQAVKMYTNMLNSDLKPNTIHMNAVLECCARAGDLDSMFTIIKTANDRLRAANNLTYTIVLNALRYQPPKNELDDPDVQDVEVQHEEKQKIAVAIDRAKAVWDEVMRKWIKGKITVDEELVCAMGRSLLPGTKSDNADIFALLDQTMRLPNLYPGRTESKTSKPPPSNSGTSEGVEPLDSEGVEPAQSKGGAPAVVEGTGEPVERVDSEAANLASSETTIQEGSEMIQAEGSEQAKQESSEPANLLGSGETSNEEGGEPDRVEGGELAKVESGKPAKLEGSKTTIPEDSELVTAEGSETAKSEGSESALPGVSETTDIESREPAKLEASGPTEAEGQDGAAPGGSDSSKVLRKTSSRTFKTPANAPLLLPRPRNNTLSLVLDALINLNVPSLGTLYWKLLTGEFTVKPDRDNYHRYLRLLRNGRASARAADVVKHMPRELANEKTFRLAFSACVADNLNHHAYQNACSILTVMLEVLHVPDAQALRMFLQAATGNFHRFQKMAETDEQAARLGLGTQLIGAVDRLWEPFRVLNSAKSYPTGNYRSPEEEWAKTRPTRMEILKLARRMLATMDKVVTERMAPDNALGILKSRRVVLTRYVTRSYGKINERDEQLKRKEDAREKHPPLQRTTPYMRAHDPRVFGSRQRDVSEVSSATPL